MTKFLGYKLTFMKHYVESGVVVRNESATIPFKENELDLLNLVVEALGFHGKDNPGTDQTTGEKFWVDGVDWEAVYQTDTI